MGPGGEDEIVLVLYKTRVQKVSTQTSMFYPHVHGTGHDRERASSLVRVATRVFHYVVIRNLKTSLKTKLYVRQLKEDKRNVNEMKLEPW